MMTERECAAAPFNGEVDEREDLIDANGAAAVVEARRLTTLGSFKKIDGHLFELIIYSNELQLVARAIDYAGVRIPKKKHDQHTYIAIKGSRICFKTTRYGSSCSATFSLSSELGDEAANGTAAFELEPHVLPAIVSIGAKRKLYFQYDQQANTLRVSTKERTNEIIFDAIFNAKRVEHDSVFDESLTNANALGVKPPEALRRGLEFASLLCREEAGTRTRRGVTIRDGAAFGGYREGIGWCSHPAFAGINADLRFDQIADVCRLLSRLSTAAETWLGEARMTFTDGPIVCTCDIAEASPIPISVRQAAHYSVTVDRKSVFYQTSLFASLASRTKREGDAIHGSVKSDANAVLELRFKPAAARDDLLRAWAGSPIILRKAPAEAPTAWTFSAYVADFVKIVEFLDVGEIEIGKSSAGLVVISDAHAGVEGFTAALRDPGRDLSDILSPQKSPPVAK